MFKEERQKQILEILNEKTFVSVSKLGELLYISLPTVRRDLAELESKGLIVRNHGGAMKLGEGAYMIPLQFRSNHKTAEKQELCKKAAKLISNGDVIFIDDSTSTMHIAEHITAQGVTVVTNGLPIAMILLEKGIKTILIGGDVFDVSYGCVGRDAERLVSQFNFNLAFFSSYGVNDRGMIVDTSHEEIGVRQTALERAQKKVFLYTADKKHLNAPYNLMSIDQVDVVISN